MRSKLARSGLASLWLLAACAVVSACDSDKAASGQDNGTVLLTGEGAPLDTPIRGCEAAVFGSLAPNWRETAIVAGPLAWPGIGGYRTRPAADFRERKGRYLFQKALAVVEAGALVKIEVPESERGRLSLAYGGSGRADNLYRLAEGKPTWALRACKDTRTEFNGGFIVAGAQCAALDVFAEGESQPDRVFIAFGTGQRPCP